MKPAEAIYTGTRAQQLLEDEVLSKAFADVRAAIIEKWEGAPVRDKEGQAELHLMLKLLNEVRGSLELAVSNGKIAAHELKSSKKQFTPAEWRALQR